MTRTVRTILAGALLPALVTTTGAQLAISDITQSYLIDFESTVAGVNNGAFGGLGFTPGATNPGELDSNAWAITGMSDGELAFGGTQTGADFARGATASAPTTGGIYAFSSGSIQGVAFGFQPGGNDMTPGTVTLRIQNNTASQITGFTLDYVVHARNNEARGNLFNFSHSADNATYEAEAALDFLSPADIGVTDFVAANRSITLLDLTLEAGASYYLRWTLDDSTGGGARDEFALDDIRLKDFSSAATTKNYWAGDGVVVGGSGTWTGAGLTWKLNQDGLGDTVAADPATPMIFMFTPGEVVIGSGAAANAGIEVTVDGYSFTGGSLLLGGTIPAIKVTNATDTLTVSATLSGAAGLRKQGGGRLVLSGANDYTGTTTVQEGTLEISADNQLGATANPIALAGGTLKTSASLILDAARAMNGFGGIEVPAGTTLTVPGSFSVGLAIKGTGTLALTGASPTLAGVTFEQAGTISSPSPLPIGGTVTTSQAEGTATIDAAVNLGSTTRFFNIADGSAAVDLRIVGNVTSDTATARLSKSGLGTLELGGEQTGLLSGISLGSATIAAPLPGGRLIVKNGTGLGTLPMFFNSGTLFADSATVVTFSNEVSIGGGQTENGSTFAGAPMIFNGKASLFVPTNGSYQHKITLETDVVFAGGFEATTFQSAGNGATSGVTVTGDGTLFLPKATNAIADTITVQGGAELTVAGSILAPIIIESTGTLSGFTNSGGDTGEQLNAVSILAGGVLAPGFAGDDDTGRLDVASLNLAAGGQLAIDLGGMGAGEFDQIVSTSTVTLDGDLSLNFFGGYVPIEGDTFTLILNNGFDPLAGAGFNGIADETPFQFMGYTFEVDYGGGDGNDVTLTVLVPEPGSAVLLMGGSFLLARRRRSGARA